jgi:hypothetical protein
VLIIKPPLPNSNYLILQKMDSEENLNKDIEKAPPSKKPQGENDDSETDALGDLSGAPSPKSTFLHLKSFFN